MSAKRGRPRNIDRAMALFREQTAGAMGVYGDSLIEIAEALVKRATKGVVQVEEEFQAAGTLTIQVHERNAETGRLEKVVRAAFPDLPPGKMVLVRRKKTTLAPSVEAGRYVTDRVMGRPTETVNVNDDISQLSDSELLARTAAIFAGREGDSGGDATPGAER